MFGMKLSLGLASCFSFLALAAPEFTEIHFSAPPGPGVLAVTVLTREPAWRLFPEDVKIEHTKKSMEYLLSYDVSKSVQALLLAASNKKETTEACKAELKALLSAPTEAISDDKLTTTIYIVLDEEHPERLTVSMKGDLKLLSAEPLSAATSEMQPWTRAVSVKLSYSAGYSISYGVSDLIVTEGAAKGTFQIETQRTGLAALKNYIADGRISPLCAEALDQGYWALEGDKTEPKNRSEKSIVLVIPMPKEVPLKIDMRPAAGFAVESVQPLE